MEKIAIFGGTFNPIHKGHRHLVEAYQSRFSFDRVLLIPTRIPPHKQVNDLAEDRHRLEMCRILAKELPFLEVSDIELKREEKSYTFDTLTELKKRYPNAVFYLIMGSDMFLTFRQWYRAEEMLGMAVLLTAAREPERMAELEQERQLQERMGGQAVVLDLPVWEISSTAIRGRIKQDLDTADLLDESVAAYIKEHRLYRDER